MGNVAKVNLEGLEKQKPGARFFELSKRADAPNATADDRAALRAFYDEVPAVVGVVGDLAQLAINRLLDTAINAHYSQREAYKAKLDTMRRDLGWAGASAAEQLLIEQVLICYLRIQIQELVYTSVMHDSGPVTLTKAEHQERMLSMTQARYLRAVEALARVRRLLKVQVNINLPGGQQVNIAGDVLT